MSKNDHWGIRENTRLEKLRIKREQLKHRNKILVYKFLGAIGTFFIFIYWFINYKGGL